MYVCMPAEIIGGLNCVSIYKSLLFERVQPPLSPYVILDQVHLSSDNLIPHNSSRPACIAFFTFIERVHIKCTALHTNPTYKEDFSKFQIETEFSKIKKVLLSG